MIQRRNALCQVLVAVARVVAAAVLVVPVADTEVVPAVLAVPVADTEEVPVVRVVSAGIALPPTDRPWAASVAMAGGTDPIPGADPMAAADACSL